MRIHEDFSRQPRPAGLTERQFGFVAGAVAAVAGSWPLFDRRQPRWWALILCVLILAVAVAKPALLRVPNRVWTKLAAAVGALVSLLATALLFYLVFTPAALLMRPAGRDALRLKRDTSAGTYWMTRPQEGAGDMADPF